MPEDIELKGHQILNPQQRGLKSVFWFKDLNLKCKV